MRAHKIQKNNKNYSPVLKHMMSLRSYTEGLLHGADLQYRNADSSYALRQESSFYYFSGFCEPSSLMVMVHQEDKISSIVFVPPKDKLREIWDGYRAGPIGAVDDYGFDHDQIRSHQLPQ